MTAPTALPHHELPGLKDTLAPVLPSLLRHAIRLTRSRADAEDLVQETVLRALRFESTFTRGTNVAAWLHQILRSVFISRCRSLSRQRAATGRYAADPTLLSVVAGPPELCAVTSTLGAALSALPAKFFRVVELVDVHDYSYREAAETLGVPVGTVMSRLFRARRLLQGAMSGESVARAA